MYQQPPGGYQPPPGGYQPPPGGAQPPPGAYQPQAGGYQQPGYGAAQPGYPGAAPQPGYPGAPQPGAPQTGYPGGYAPQGPGTGGCPPGMDPTLHSWFVSVDQDNSGKITADELRKALLNGNWSQFNPETCRLMIGMFDKDQSGTIDMNEFSALWQYIQQWKGTFERYDNDRSGAIEQNELMRAFTEMGYRVSPQFVSVLISKYDRVARRSLKLDEFIQSCVMMRSLTEAFKSRDTNLSGSITISYEDFMSLVLLNQP